MEMNAEADKDLIAAKKAADKEALKAAKRSHDVSISSDPIDPQTPAPKKALTRTDKLKAQAVLIEQASDDIGRQNKRLADRWRCTDERCMNEQKKGWCFVDRGGKHYHGSYSNASMSKGIATRRASCLY